MAIGLPLAIALVYLSVLFKPWMQMESRRSLTAEESGKLWEQCNSLFRQTRYQEALPGVLELHETYPGSHIYIAMAAEIYDHLGSYEQEAELWEQYFDRAPIPITACPQIGQAYWKQGKVKDGISAFERCLAQDPDNSDSIFFLAHAFELSGQLGRAAELYRRGLKIAPEYMDLQTGLARVCLHQGKVPEAEQIVLQALRKSPQNVDALLVAGLIYLREGNLDKARQYLEKGVKLSDGYLDFHFALAEIAEAEHNFLEAIREYEKILKDHPDDPGVRAKREALMEKH